MQSMCFAVLADGVHYAGILSRSLYTAIAPCIAVFCGLLSGVLICAHLASAYAYSVCHAMFRYVKCS